MRIVCIEDPGTDKALLATKAKIPDVPIVTLIHDSAGRAQSAATPKTDLLQLLCNAEPTLVAGGAKLEGFDIIGHGAPGSLSIGATAANGPVSGHQWATVDPDMDKLAAWVPLATTLRQWSGNGWLAPDFELRLLGCRTAVDPGIVPDASLTSTFDGAALIHLLSSFLDVPVVGTLGYIYPSNFSVVDGEVIFSGVPTRRCWVDAVSQAVEFVPATTAVAAPAPENTIELVSWPSDRDGLFSAYAPIGHRLDRPDPLVASVTPAVETTAIVTPATDDSPIATLVLGEGDAPASYQVVEHAGALLVRLAGVGCYRFTVKPDDYPSAVSETVRLLSGPNDFAIPPAWANRRTLQRLKLGMLTSGPQHG